MGRCCVGYGFCVKQLFNGLTTRIRRYCFVPEFPLAVRDCLFTGVRIVGIASLQNTAGPVYLLGFPSMIPCLTFLTTATTPAQNKCESMFQKSVFHVADGWFNCLSRMALNCLKGQKVRNGTAKICIIGCILPLSAAGYPTSKNTRRNTMFRYGTTHPT